MNIGYRISNVECRTTNFASRPTCFLPRGIHREVPPLGLRIAKAGRGAVLLCSCALAFFVVGCETPDSQKNTLSEQIETLKHDKSRLTRQIEQSKSKNKDLQQQINTLHNLAGKIDLEKLYDVQRLKITKHSNLHDKDKDKDGKKETLIIYIQPIDQDGDIVKAAGSVDVQLLNLNEEEPQLLGQWHVGPVELRKLWFNALMMTNYRLTFDVSDKVQTFEEPLTVNVTFTDYLTGKVLKEQKVIKPP